MRPFSARIVLTPSEQYSHVGHADEGCGFGGAGASDGRLAAVEHRFPLVWHCKPDTHGASMGEYNLHGWLSAINSIKSLPLP